MLLAFSLLLGLLASAASNTLEQRVEQLRDISYRSPVIKLDDDKYKTFIRTMPRNYSVVVMFTAMAPNRNCKICKETHNEFTTLAHSFRYSRAFDSQLFFTMVDYDGGAAIFQRLRLTSAPVIIHFPANGKRKKEDRYDLERRGIQAESVGKWVKERTEVNVEIIRQPNYTNAILLGVFLFAVSGTLFIKGNSLDFLYKWRYWAITSMFIMFAMTSGQMWLHIRGAPFAHVDRNSGRTSFIHGSSNMMFVAESYIVAIVNGIICLGFILLADAPKDAANPMSKYMSYGGLATVVLFFSILLAIFRMKHRGYPYSLLF